MRIHIQIDIRALLKRHIKVKKNNSEWAWVDFKYKSLGTFYFYFVCVRLGHSERFYFMTFSLNMGLFAPT